MERLDDDDDDDGLDVILVQEGILLNIDWVWILECVKDPSLGTVHINVSPSHWGVDTASFESSKDRLRALDPTKEPRRGVKF